MNQLQNSKNEPLVEKGLVQKNIKNNILILVLTCLHWLLFYHQSYGINYLLFSIAIISSLLIRNQRLLISPKFYLLAFCVLISGFSTCYYGIESMAIANIVSVFILCTFTEAPNSSIIVLLIQYLFTLMTSVYTFFIDLIKIKKGPNSTIAKYMKYAILSIIPVGIALIFLAIYACSNPFLSDLIHQINFSFISVVGLCYFIYSFFVIYSHLRQNHIRSLNDYETEQTNELKESLDTDIPLFQNFLSIKSELYIAFVVLFLLNIILGLNNGLDIFYLFFKKTMPLGVSYSEYIHNGVNALIISIVLAILVIMVLFNQKISFQHSIKKIKIAAYFWIFQNIVLAVICMYKNYNYIEEFGYTNKRIGVYLFLILCFFGLVFTSIKVRLNKNNRYLIRYNSWTSFVILMLYFCIDWSSVIAKNQLTNIKNPDYTYILDQHYTALPYVYNHLKITTAEAIEIKKQIDSTSFYSTQNEPIKNRIVREIINLNLKEKSSEWPSYCVSKNNISSSINL